MNFGKEMTNNGQLYNSDYTLMLYMDKSDPLLQLVAVNKVLPHN